MWLREHIREADIAARNATQRTPQPPPAQFATPPQNATTLATGSKLSFKRCFDIFRKTFIGMSGFPHAKQQFKGTNHCHDTGCAGCGSLEHNYAECPAQTITRKEARDTMLVERSSARHRRDQRHRVRSRGRESLQLMGRPS